jgi:hypothetical protein
MATQSLDSCVTTVRDRPLPKEVLSFFEYKQESRLFVCIADNTTTWRDDLILGERLFGDVVICAHGDALTELDAKLDETRDVLKQRMKYPGVKENPALEQIAKTWILPTKLFKGPSVSEILTTQEGSLPARFTPIFETTRSERQIIHFLSVSCESGATRQVLYKVLDEGFRPSLLCVKWSHDMDDHIPTAHCVGHLLNVGYQQIYQNDATGYALYMFSDQPLYDICSVKGVALRNPFMESLLQSVTVVQQTQATQVQEGQAEQTQAVQTQAEPAVTQ